MCIDEKKFEHVGDTVMSVGDVRNALTSMPDDMPLWFITANVPGSRQSGEEQVAGAAGTAGMRRPARVTWVSSSNWSSHRPQLPHEGSRMRSGRGRESNAFPPCVLSLA